jgi:transposase InsO family protein
MKNVQNERKRLEIQEFRYGIIADLLNPYLEKQEYQELLASKASREYAIPYSKKRSITTATIKNWVRAFREQGKSGLLPQYRSDKGSPKSFTETEQHELIKYLETHTRVTAWTAVRYLQKQGKITSRISQSALSRFVINQGLTSEQRNQNIKREKQMKYQHEYPLECIQADAMHAFQVPERPGKTKKAILLAFIDDATRRIVYANFAFTERSYEFEKGIKHILLSHGKIGKLYTDNGATFVSDQTKRIVSILGIPLIHSRPGKPAGRGKIERFFRTVRDQFLRPLDKEAIKSIDQLNLKFKTWLESEYHRNPHRGLANQTPLECWLQKAHYIISMPQHIDLNEVFMHELPRKIYNDNTFSLDGTLYEVPILLEQQKIKIRFNPETRNPVRVYHGETHLTDAKIVDTYANARIIRNTYSKNISQEEEPSDQHIDKPAGSTGHAVSSSLAASRIQGGNK